MRQRGPKSAGAFDGGKTKLDQAFRAAVALDRSALNQDAPARTRNASGPYAGYLSWSHLSKLLAARAQDLGLNAFWDAGTVEKALRGEKGLPSNLQERQVFFEATQHVMNECFDIAQETFHRAPGPQHSYLKFLGAEPKAPTFFEFDFNPVDIGFINIIDWNESRQLDRHNNVGTTEIETQREEQDWVPDELLEPLLQEELNSDPGSPCPTLVGFIRDTREAQGQQLILKVAQSHYYRHVAIRTCLRRNPDLYAHIMQRISRSDGEGGLSSLIARSPDSNIVINVTVQSREGELLLIKRPVGARLWAETYQVGAHETMNWPNAGANVETCYELAERALAEEIGIKRSEEYYHKIVFSWFGYYLREASTYFFAHVRTRLTRQQILDRIDLAPSRWEIGDTDWMWPVREEITPILDTWRNGPYEFGEDPLRRVWLPHSMLSLGQLHRVMRQGMLDPIDAAALPARPGRGQGPRG